MPWSPSYTEDEARSAISNARCWAEALRSLGLTVHGKNLSVLRKWAERWRIPTERLPDYQSMKPRACRFNEAELREAIQASDSWAGALRYLKYRSRGGNWKTLKKYAEIWGIDSSHFDSRAASLRGIRRRKKQQLADLLVKGSTIASSKLKDRLLEEGIKDRACELCGQGEIWRGKRMALILDHINGEPDDNRLENLRIACPNCAATFETHCGRKNRRPPPDPRSCVLCGVDYEPKRSSQRYCSRTCAQAVGKQNGQSYRRADRPPHDELLRMIDEFGYLGVGRIFGVSDNAIRKWVRFYERERAIEEGRDPDVVEIPKRTWPNRRRDEAA